jgi:pimeloyl-ACP methyl ester carboxylesterase
MKLFYRHFGEGQPVIILHGLFGISDNWVTIGKRLADKYEVFIPDQRNHGRSPHSDTFNYYALVDDLYEFIEDHRLINPVIMGHSMGGKVAMNFALEHPSKIDRLVVIDMSVREYKARKQHIEIIEALLSVDMSKIKSRAEVERIVSQKIESPRIRQFVMKNLYRINSNTFGWRINIKAIYESLEDIFVGIDSPYTFEKPALFIKGELSDYILDEDYDLIKKYFPNVTFQTIKNASHWVHAEKPDELCELFSGFMENRI